MSERFDEYCRRKIEAATTARVPGYNSVRGSADLAHTLVEVASDWTRALFDGAFYRCAPEGRGLPAVSLVFVRSRDGNTVTRDPSSLGGGETDTHLIYEGLSRVDADAVLAGATTAAGDNLVFSVWHPELVKLRLARNHSRHPAQVILTERGDLPVHRALLYNERSLRTIVITGAAAAAVLARRLEGRPWVEVIDVGTPVDLPRALAALYARGLRAISAVGGRSTASALMAAGSVDELYLTTSSRAGGEPGTPLFDGRMPPHRVVLEKQGRDEERGVRFEHLVFRRQGPSVL